jgi:4,5-dihydroxyphthalate decarboxylase
VTGIAGLLISCYFCEISDVDQSGREYVGRSQAGWAFSAVGFPVSAGLNLKVACDPFEFVRALEERHVTAAGLNLDFQPEMSNPVRHKAMARDLAFDVCELNITTYLIARDQGISLTAIPVFLFRKFRHGNVFVNAKSGIRNPSDLVGAKVGCPTLQPASNVWIHGILEDEYAVPFRQIKWVVEREEDLPFKVPPGIQIERAPAGRSVAKMLLDGELDAVSAQQTPKELLSGNGRLNRLFPNYVELEKAYYARTGIFPIMHVTALPTALVEREPWIVRSLMQAFEASKQDALKRFSNTRIATLAWFGALWEEEARLLGSDPWEFGLGPVNRTNIETAVRYAFAQGFISKPFAVDELFVPGELL